MKKESAVMEEWKRKKLNNWNALKKMFAIMTGKRMEREETIELNLVMM